MSIGSGLVDEYKVRVGRPEPVARSATGAGPEGPPGGKWRGRNKAAVKVGRPEPEARSATPRRRPKCREGGANPWRGAQHHAVGPVRVQ